MQQNNPSTQKLWVDMFCSNEQIFSTCNRIVQPEFFDPDYRDAVEFTKHYYDKYSALPSCEILEAETGFQPRKMNIKPDEVEYCISKVEQFCRERAVYIEVLNSSRTIEKGGHADLLSRLEAAVNISLNRDLGVNIFENIESRIKKRMESRQPVSTGWENLDKELGGGLCRTELMMISAGSGGGKSIALSNYAIHMAGKGYNVLYISLELGEEFVADRLETMITKMTKTERYERISDTVNKMDEFRSASQGTIHVKRMEADVACSADIKAYIKEYYMVYGCYPDVLVVDYLDILASNTKIHYSNAFDKDKAVSTQLRNIGNNDIHPMWMATASQENRSAINETDKNQSHIAGGLSKVNTVDVYISIIMTDAMRALGTCSWKLLKTRSSGGVGKSIFMKWDPVYLWFTSDNNPSGRDDAPDTSSKSSPKGVPPASKPGKSGYGTGMDSILEN